MTRQRRVRNVTEHQSIPTPLLDDSTNWSTGLASLGLTPTTIRHTYATLSLDSGIDPKIVSDRIGHANMAYTLSIYTHRSTGRDKTAARKVADVIFGDDRQGPPGPEDNAA